MAKVVAFAGSKGGTGKSTLSHLAAHGAGSLPRPIPAVVITTDPEDGLAEGERRYVVVDGRSPTLLADQLQRLLGIERLLVVVDGAANRADVDRVLAEIADLVVIPYGPSAQDGARAVANLDGLPAAVALPNRWPTHPGVAKRARRWLEAVPASRRLPTLRAIPRLDALLGPDSYGEIAYDIASPARGLILELLARAGIDPDKLAGKRQDITIS
jgi:chromosome partitioning protein